MKIDQRNIAKVIADTTGDKTTEQVELDMLNRTTLNPDEAVGYALVHEIKSELLPEGADLTVINEKNRYDFVSEFIFISLLYTL